MISCVIAATLVVPTPADTAWVEVARRIGEETGVVFGRVEAVEVHDDGTTFVLDGFEKQLRAFSSDGAAVWSIGREGQGPGEFDSPVGITWAPDGSLWVIDPGNQRATAVERRGEIVGSYRIPSGFSLAPWPGRFDTRGRFYHYTEVAGSSYGYAMAIYDEGLDRVGVAIPPVPPGEEEFFQGRTERGSHMRARVPYHAAIHLEVGQQGPVRIELECGTPFPWPLRNDGRNGGQERHRPGRDGGRPTRRHGDPVVFHPARRTDRTGSDPGTTARRSHLRPR